MQRLLTLIILTGCTLFVLAGNLQDGTKRVRYKDGPAYIYRVSLTDKADTPYSFDHPTRFLSRRAIERRERQGLAIDSTDLPVSSHYVRLIKKEGVTIVGQSRWQNTVLIRLKDSTLVSGIRQLPCVKACKLVWLSPDSITPDKRIDYQSHFEPYDSIPNEIYGTAADQIYNLKGDQLHRAGFLGKGMMIAVIDGGFKNADRIPELQKIKILGWHDFVSPNDPQLFSETDHGTKVLSIMGAYHPHIFIGTAPKAGYWLLRSEDQLTEQEVEEDYWTMAAEFADSVGCDVINSSLGYNEYDHKWMSYKQWQLDGKTAFVSRSAAMLAQKGIILCNSAGNSGMGPWKKIGVPADAENILTVGAISDIETQRIAAFSSVGPTQDGRVKPDVVALGAPARVISGRGTITSSMGTSFSSPVVCGLVACLWQAMQDKTASEIIDIIRRTGNNYQHPDNIYGYGVPDFWQAFLKGKVKSEE
jgi:subtilisin family serine protease